MVSIARSASRASAGWVSITRLPTPAWMAMMPMLCATMSCNSRAIRSRSAVTASATSCERSATVCSRRSRLSRPTMQEAAIARTAITALTVRPSPWAKPPTIRSWATKDTATATIDVRRAAVATM